MTHIIAIANQKGGVGKTTTAINLATALARGLTGTQHKVLLIDIDSQANATSVLLTPEFTLGDNAEIPTVYEVLVNQIDPHEVIITVELAGESPGKLDLIPSHIRLARAEWELVGAIRREDRLSTAVTRLVGEYDYIFIDCPPSLGLLTINGLMAANQVIITAEPSAFSLMGIALLNDTIREIRNINNLELLGVALVRKDNTTETRYTLEELMTHFPDNLLPAIPDRVAIRKAHAQGHDIFGFDPKNDAAHAYIRMAQEVENGS